MSRSHAHRQASELKLPIVHSFKCRLVLMELLDRLRSDDTLRCQGWGGCVSGGGGGWQAFLKLLLLTFFFGTFFSALEPTPGSNGSPLTPTPRYNDCDARLEGYVIR